MIKKLFTSILLLGVALTSWGTIYPTPATPDETGELTLKYVNDGNGFVCENGTTLSDVQDAFAGKVTDLTLEGDFTNTDMCNNGVVDNFILAVAASTGVNLDMKGCTALVSKFVSVSDAGSESGLSSASVYTTFEYEIPNRTYQQVNVVKETVYTYKGKVVDSSTLLSDDDGYYFLEYIEDGDLWNGDPSTLTMNEEGTEGTYTTEGCTDGYEPYPGQQILEDEEGKPYYSAWGNNPCPPENRHYIETISHTVTVKKCHVHTAVHWVYESDHSVVVAEKDVTKTSETTGYVSHGTGGDEIGFEKSKDIIKSFQFPVSDNFTYIPEKLFADAKLLESVVLSPKIQAIGNRAFGKASKLETINFPASLVAMGGDVFKETSLISAKMADTHLDKIRYFSFQDCTKLEEVTFPSTITEIQTQAFIRCGLIETVDLSNCHDLTMIAQQAFSECVKISYVKICSDPKVIKGEIGGGEGLGAFFHDKAIQTVEIVGCDDTDMTECVCENRAFDVNITYGQTSAINVEGCARLIYPEDGLIDEESDYDSAFDYFVGDYKAGVLISHESLLAYFRNVPANGTSSEAKRTYWNGTQDVDETYTVTCMYQQGNGWHEFLNVGRGEVIQKGEFLRTYSRSRGDGPCVLPKELTAYRAIDYKSTATGFVYDKKNGNYYLTVEGEAKPESERKEKVDYIEITSSTPASDYAGRPLYSKLTIGGKLLLKPLWAKVAEYGQKRGYAANKAFFDDKMVNSTDLTSAQLSYVPEKTGVVLYSTRISEAAFLILPSYDDDDLVLTEYEHTEARYEEDRPSTDPDNINMLQGSYDTGWPVAPVEPWIYKDNTNYTGGHYDVTKEYRDFACVLTGTVTTNGKEVNTYGWKRLTPSKLKVNRAYAKIPVGRFDNFNETVDQMPDFTLEDKIVEESDANMLLLSSFDDMVMGEGETDAIKTVNTTVVNTNDDAWYTIQGVRVAQPTKGIYIHNNKKVVIK